MFALIHTSLWCCFVSLNVAASWQRFLSACLSPSAVYQITITPAPLTHLALLPSLCNYFSLKSLNKTWYAGVGGLGAVSLCVQLYTLMKEPTRTPVKWKEFYLDAESVFVAFCLLFVFVFAFGWLSFCLPVVQKQMYSLSKNLWKQRNNSS